MQFVDYSPGAPFTLILEADVDGDGIMDSLASAEVMNEIPQGDVSLNVTSDANGIMLDWSVEGWTLQSAPSIHGPWTDIQAPADQSTFTIIPSGPAKFYRLNQMKSPLAP